jgi:hypothetical protein
LGNALILLNAVEWLDLVLVGQSFAQSFEERLVGREGNKQMMRVGDSLVLLLGWLGGAGVLTRRCFFCVVVSTKFFKEF